MIFCIWKSPVETLNTSYSLLIISQDMHMLPHSQQNYCYCCYTTLQRPCPSLWYSVSVTAWSRRRVLECVSIYFANLLGIHNLQTTPYHPKTNGLTEHMNQTVLAMLRNTKHCEKTMSIRSFMLMTAQNTIVQGFI